MLALLLAVGLAIAEDAERAVQLLIAGDAPAEQLEQARRTVEEAAAREPGSNRWQFGKAFVLEAKGDRIAARDLLQKVVEREPGSAEYQAWYGRAIFEAIDETGMLTKLSWGLRGKAALEKAVELDPGHVLARVGLVEFYLEAPGLAGGSVAKAEEQAKALVAIPDGRGEFQGRLALAGIAKQRKAWAEMDRQYALAESAKGSGADPVAAMTLRAQALLGEADDAKGALAVADRLALVAKPDNVSPLFLRAEAQRKLGSCKTAVEDYERVLARKPEARNSRFGVALCYEKLHDAAHAISAYEEFTRRFPEDPRASDARAAVKRLKKPA